MESASGTATATSSEKTHVLCIPFPAQGHISPMLQLAKLLHSTGFFHITFVNTEYNHQRLVRSRGPASVRGLDDFRFETIPDGLPTEEQDRTQDIPTLCDSITRNCNRPFLALLKKLTAGVPRLSCIIVDGVMSVTLQAAEEMGIPAYVFYTVSACGLMCYLHFPELIQRGYVPLKDESCLSNGYLNTQIDWIPGMKGISLKDLPSFIRTTNPDDIMLNYDFNNARNAARGKAIILNTFDDLERDILDGIKSKFSHRLFTIGPLPLLITRRLTSTATVESLPSSMGASLWKEDTTCLEWLDMKPPNSVLYVNFGSITVVTMEQMREFAWGLALNNQQVLWVIRPDMVEGDSAVLPEGFVEETRGRCMLASWCPQERVLAHPSVGAFLTHCGWNSTLESLFSGVPMICWPFFAEQQTNCRFACREWEVGVETGVEGKVKREELEKIVRELMEGERGREMKKRALEWKEKGERAVERDGSSYLHMENLISELLQCKTGG